jgi:uncharacterized iron-regulated membrane protein
MKSPWGWRSLAFKIHLVGGLMAAALLLILGVTGPIMAFASEMDSRLHPSPSGLQLQEGMAMCRS